MTTTTPKEPFFEPWGVLRLMRRGSHPRVGRMTGAIPSNRRLPMTTFKTMTAAAALMVLAGAAHAAAVIMDARTPPNAPVYWGVSTDPMPDDRLPGMMECIQSGMAAAGHTQWVGPPVAYVTANCTAKIKAQVQAAAMAQAAVDAASQQQADAAQQQADAQHALVVDRLQREADAAAAAEAKREAQADAAHAQAVAHRVDNCSYIDAFQATSPTAVPLTPAVEARVLALRAPQEAACRAAAHEQAVKAAAAAQAEADRAALERAAAPPPAAQVAPPPAEWRRYEPRYELPPSSDDTPATPLYGGPDQKPWCAGTPTMIQTPAGSFPTGC